MTVSYYIRYHGAAVDRDAFLDHYRDVHVPHLLRFPGIRSVIMHHAAASIDPASLHRRLLARLSEASSIPPASR